MRQMHLEFFCLTGNDREAVALRWAALSADGRSAYVFCLQLYLWMFFFYIFQELVLRESLAFCISDLIL